MLRILLAWELGGALGHLASLRPLAKAFCQRGCEVFLAARDLSQVRRVFAGLPVVPLQSPWNSRRLQPIDPVVTYADLLLNVGFAELDSLACHVQAWRVLYRALQPQLLVCDHSPTALLAARGQGFPVATAGTGFFVPVDESPLRFLREASDELRPQVAKHEALLLDVLNRIVRASGCQLLDRATQLYHDASIHHFLLTFPELDHFGPRTGAKYWGTWPFGVEGTSFVRSNSVPNIFAYLKPFPALADVLADLSTAPCNTIAYVDSLKESERVKWQSDRLQLLRTPINITRAAEACDLAITNATHGTCIAMLLHGKPLVHVPHFLEQALFAAATERIGVSVTAQPHETFGTRNAILRVVGDPSYTAAANIFRDRYKTHDFETAADEIVNEMARLVTAH